MHAALTSEAAPPSTYQWADSIDAADIVLYPVRPWTEDPPARGLRPLLRCLDRLYLYSTADRPVLWAPGAFPATTTPRVTTGAGYVLGMLGEDRLAPDAPPDALWSFIGSVNTCPRVRSRIVAVNDQRAILEDTAQWSAIRWEASSDRQAAIDRYSTSLQRSLFVVCPRGVSPSSFRIYEAMRAGRCPVIVSDDWIAPPGIDWSTCSVRIPEADVDQLPRLLRELEPQGRALGATARDVWQAKLSPAGLVHTIIEGCFALHEDITRRDRIRMAAGAAVTAEAWRQVRALTR